MTETLVSEKLDEKALRRPTFKEGWRVKLADGQEWSLPRPVIRWKPVAGINGQLVDSMVTFRLDGSNRFSSLVHEYEELADRADSTNVDYVNWEIRMATELLLANYDLTIDQIGELIQFAYGDDAEESDPEGARMRRECMMVARGIGPKSSAGGESSTPTPPA